MLLFCPATVMLGHGTWCCPSQLEVTVALRKAGVRQRQLWLNVESPIFFTGHSSSYCVEGRVPVLWLIYSLHLKLINLPVILNLKLIKEGVPLLTVPTLRAVRQWGRTCFEAGGGEPVPSYHCHSLLLPYAVAVPGGITMAPSLRDGDGELPACRGTPDPSCVLLTSQVGRLHIPEPGTTQV